MQVYIVIRYVFSLPVNLSISEVDDDDFDDDDFHDVYDDDSN